MIFSDKLLSQTLVSLCQAKQINHIVISPGSRNAPLTIGFTHNPEFTCYSIVDERCAAFFALGMAQNLKTPVILCCTSGSALLNYYPAIAEAFYSDIPLIIISADRPSHFIDIGDGQTIRQENVFENHILYSATCYEGEDQQTHNERELNIALNTAMELQGPVHINIPFSEPLYRTTEHKIIWPQDVPFRHEQQQLDEPLDSFINIWNTAAKKMILVGVLQPNSIEEKFIELLANDESVLVLTETTSNLHHPKFIHTIDSLIAPLDEDEFNLLKPDLLLTFGGMVISKKIKAFLRTHAPISHWHVDTKKAYDTYFALTHHFKIPINLFLSEFLPKVETSIGNYQKKWLQVLEHRNERRKVYENEIPYSDFYSFAKIFNSLPKNSVLQLANSATIRYAQLFNIQKTCDVYCNRGTSGIDGCTSTAIGHAVVSKKDIVFLTGDLAFFYDSNALWNNYIPKNFKIILVNNGGGGIFRILPGDKQATNFKTYFETEHKFTAKQLCDMYGFQYTTATNENSLNEELQSFFQNNEKPKLLEIFTPADLNDVVLLEYFNFIK